MDNIKMDIQEMGWVGMDGSDLAKVGTDGGCFCMR
jgi:hypothetical protein